MATPISSHSGAVIPLRTKLQKPPALVRQHLRQFVITGSMAAPWRYLSFRAGSQTAVSTHRTLLMTCPRSWAGTSAAWSWACWCWHLCTTPTSWETPSRCECRPAASFSQSVSADRCFGLLWLFFNLGWLDSTRTDFQIVGFVFFCFVNGREPEQRKPVSSTFSPPDQMTKLKPSMPSIRKVSGWISIHGRAQLAVTPDIVLYRWPSCHLDTRWPPSHQPQTADGRDEVFRRKHFDHLFASPND